MKKSTLPTPAYTSPESDVRKSAAWVANAAAATVAAARSRSARCTRNARYVSASAIKIAARNAANPGAPISRKRETKPLSIGPTGMSVRALAEPASAPLDPVRPSP